MHLWSFLHRRCMWALLKSFCNRANPTKHVDEHFVRLCCQTRGAHIFGKYTKSPNQSRHRAPQSQIGTLALRCEAPNVIPFAKLCKSTWMDVAIRKFTRICTYIYINWCRLNVCLRVSMHIYQIDELNLRFIEFLSNNMSCWFDWFVRWISHEI